MVADSQVMRFEQLLTPQMGPLLTREIRRYRVFSTHLPLSRESEGARGSREKHTSSIAIPNFSVCRIMRFIDTSLRAAACSELLNSRGVYFAGNALRAAAYHFSEKEDDGMHFAETALRAVTHSVTTSSATVTDLAGTAPRAASFLRCMALAIW